jgi:hypothetical protein
MSHSGPYKERMMHIKFRRRVHFHPAHLLWINLENNVHMI